MITAIVAWIEAKYNHGYDEIFFGTFFIDIWGIIGTTDVLSSWLS